MGDSIAYFWFRVRTGKQDKCWPWKLKKEKDGYCRIKYPVNGERRVHRIAWTIKYGPIPTGLSVLHHCDNPTCCNPKHLFLGTPGDNSKDMVKKGRQPKGEKNGGSKLTEEQVTEIRSYVRDGIKLNTIACTFDVTKGHISNITRAKGKLWK